MNKSLVSLLTLTLGGWFLCKPHAGAQGPIWPPPPPCYEPPYCPYFPSFQGFLTDRGVPADGLYDIITRIYDAPTGGHLIGPPTTNKNVRVLGGLFTIYVKVPAGLSNLPGVDDNTWWLEHCIQHPADPICQVIEPRQRISPTVQSLYANLAASVSDGAVTATKLAPGAVSNIALGDGAVTGEKLAGGAAVRSLNGLRDDVTLSAGSGLALHAMGPDIVFDLVRNCADYEHCYWKLLGNAGTVDAVNFVGTTDEVPLNLRVNNLRVMRYEYPAGSASPKLIGGYGGNYVSSVGGTISGGGRLTGINKVLGDYGTIGGGFTNVIEFAPSSTIGGGDGNTIHNEVVSGTIGGGSSHNLDGPAYWPTIGGGLNNRIEGGEANSISGGENNKIRSGPYATVGGGGVNTVAAGWGTISGGGRNRIEAMAMASTIGGGEQNLIDTNAWYATVGGGYTNVILPDSRYSTIAGGRTNIIHANSPNSTIGGGQANAIRTNSPFSTISGGERNSVMPGAHHAAVGGGEGNTIQPAASHSAIGGGIGNIIWTNAYFSAVGGGQQNSITPTAPWSFIGGGTLNRVQSDYATLGGGRDNQIQLRSERATIAGGHGNLVTNAPYASIGGGATNTATASYATVPGGTRAVASHYGQMANASGRFANDGDAQTSVFVVRNSTSINAPTVELFLDGSAQRMTIPDGATWTFDILVSGRNANAVGGISAGYHFNGAIKRVGAATTLVGGLVRQEFEDAAAAAWNVDVVADNLNEALVIRATGSTSDTVRWVARVRTAEVMFP